MSDHAPFTLQIFVVDGDPDGLRIIERSNWTGKTLVFPRAVYPQVRNRSEFQQTGVYLLLGPRTEGEGETLYVGEGDPIRPRLDDHHAKKDFWTKSVFFVAGPGQLNKAHVQYLEARLINLATSAKRMPLVNEVIPTEPTLSESDKASMDVFLSNILGILPVLNINAFELSPHSLPGGALNAFSCRGRDVKASGVDTPQGFVVKAGSFAAEKLVPSLNKHFPQVGKLRSDLLKSGVLVIDGKKLRFTQNYTFNSPSMASTIVLGHSSNGRISWKNSEGKTLKELQQAQANKKETVKE